ncbi:hypothetical protein D3C80_1838830 [compost metagenome]
MIVIFEFRLGRQNGIIVVLGQLHFGILLFQLQIILNPDNRTKASRLWNCRQSRRGENNLAERRQPQFLLKELLLCLQTAQDTFNCRFLLLRLKLGSFQVLFREKSGIIQGKRIIRLRI